MERRLMKKMKKKFPLASETVILPVMEAERLAGMEIPAEYFTKETGGACVTSVEACISQTDPTNRFVDVQGCIFPVDPKAPAIEWELVLPMKWNGRSLQMGGGANNGIIPQVKKEAILCSVVPADLGYVVYGSDSGHQSESPMEAEFASNAEALENYVRLGLIKMQDLMLYIVERFYGQKPVLNYFAGGSTGGREALECATTYGSRYNGIFCCEPSSNYVLLRMWGAILSQAVYESYHPVNYPYSDGFIDEKTIAAIQKEAIERYDELDGIKDGIVSNIYAARMDRDCFLEFITEKYHLTEAQRKTLDVYENGFKLDYKMPNGMDSYRGCCALEGGLMDLGPDPVPREPLDTKYNVHHGDRADGVFKYFIAKDKNWRLLEHDYYHPDETLYEMLMTASECYDANRPRFDDFIENDGKMIFVAGWSDMSISPWQLIQQYYSYVERYGQEQLDSFLKFYVMPSVTHCAGIRMDYLKWLDEWCSTGEYPKCVLYADMEKTGGQMPMALFPGWVKYIGGDPKDGKSYEVSYEIPEGFWERYD